MYDLSCLWSVRGKRAAEDEEAKLFPGGIGKHIPKEDRAGWAMRNHRNWARGRACGADVEREAQDADVHVPHDGRTKRERLLAAIVLVSIREPRRTTSMPAVEVSP